MKKIFALFYSIVLSAASFAFTTKNINERVLQTFKESFPNAEQVEWKEFTDAYIVNFIEDGIRTQITYEKDGTFVSSRRYYQERNLPYYLLINIKKKYPDKKIFGVTEVSDLSEIEYFIKMEDGHVWTTVKMDSEGNLVVVEKLKKAS